MTKKHEPDARLGTGAVGDPDNPDVTHNVSVPPTAPVKKTAASKPVKKDEDDK